MTTSTSGGELNADLLRNWHWRLLGPSTPAGHAWTVVGVASAPKTLYVTTASGGVWKSVNAGTTFEPIFDDAHVASSSVVAVAPSNPDIVWVATGEPANTRANSWGDGVYKSENGGESWTHAGLSETHMIGHLIIHPTNPDIVYVAAMGRLWGRNEERGVFRTSNGGRSWDKVLYVDDTTGFNDIQMHPENPDVLYAGAWQRFRYGGGDMVESGPRSGLYKSTNGGDTWTVLRTVEAISGGASRSEEKTSFVRVRFMQAVINVRAAPVKLSTCRTNRSACGLCLEGYEAYPVFEA